MFRLRSYQREAIEKAQQTKEKKTVIVLPTGSGKSIICAKLAINKKALILVPSRELAKQNTEKIEEEVDQWFTGSSSIPSAKIIVSTYASALIKQKKILSQKWEIVLIDEAHKINPTTKMGSLLNEIKTDKIVGLTATPYRLDSGLIFGDKPSQFFDECIYESTRFELMTKGFLSSRNFCEVPALLNGEGIQKVGGDYQAQELSNRVQDKSLQCLDRLPVLENGLFFAVDVQHANKVAEHLDCPVITGNTPSSIRTSLLNDFKTGKNSKMVSVETLTTGFNYPNLKNIVILRPTHSRVLYEQILGRGDRIKDDGLNECNIYDFTDNFFRFVIDFNPFKHSASRIKKCPYCASLTDFKRRVCSICDRDLRPALNTGLSMTVCHRCDHKNFTRASYCKKCNEPLKNARYTEKPHNFIKLKTLSITYASIDKGWGVMINNDPRFILSFTHKEMLTNPFASIEGLLKKLIRGKPVIFKLEHKMFASRNMDGDLSLEKLK